MRNSDSVAAVRSAVVSIFTNQFIWKFALSALLTGFDGSVLVTAGQAVYEVRNDLPWLAIGFVFTAIALLVTLGRIWFLTFRQARVD
jgi:hypothetical protein